MTNQSPPARPDGDALKKYRLLADRLRWIYEQRSIDLPLAGEVLKKLPEIISGLDALVATSPARDAAEDGDWQLVPKEPTLEMQQAGYAALKLFFPDVVNPIGHYRIYEAVLAAAPVPPKPAPDAVRAALRVAEGDVRYILAKLNAYQPNNALNAARQAHDRISAALAAPVPPADGAREPYDIGVSADAINAFVDNLSPSATGAAEPDKTHFLEGWMNDEYAKRTTPPVRGDREAIARIIDPLPFSKLEELDAREAFPNVRGRRGWQARANAALEIADKLVTLHVQPGAGERGADQDRLIAMMALALQTAQTAFHHPAVSSEAQAAALSSITIALNMEAEHWQKYARLSRQPPQSSSDGEGR